MSDDCHLHSSAFICIHLKDPACSDKFLYDEDGRPCTILVHARDSPKYINALENACVRRSARKLLDPQFSDDLDEKYRENAKFLADLTHSVRNMSDGENLFESKDDMFQLYVDHSFSWITNQISNALEASEKRDECLKESPVDKKTVVHSEELWKRLGCKK